VAAGNEAAADQADNSSTATIAVGCPNVTVVKTADNGTINAGDTAAFTIVVSNSGAGTATNVTLSDNLPPGIDWSEDSDACAIAAGVLTCNFGNLAPSASATVHLSGATDAADCGVLTNTATVAASNEAAADQADNSSTATIAVDCPNVKVEKLANSGTISAGDLASFTITVSSNGQGTANNVTLTDNLPAGVAWSEDSPFCSIAAGVLTCNFGNLASGQTRIIHVTGATDAADCGTLLNTVAVAATNEPAASLGDNNAAATITVQCPQLTIAKTADGAIVNPGQPIGFTITVTNLGPGAANGVILSDPLPIKTGSSWSINPVVAGCAITSNTLNCSFGNLAAGESRTVHITSPTAVAGCGVYNNTATASAANNPPVQASASTTVRCPINTGAKTIGFWQNKNGQGIITKAGAVSGVCKLTPWLRQFKPFQDLSASASCKAVATYVTNVIKAADSSGAAMNAMLKAQMLATALDVYFSDPALGGNKIGALAPIGGVPIDLTKICKIASGSGGVTTCSGYQNVGGAFGGASTMTVIQMLNYAGGVTPGNTANPGVGGNPWYGNVKATQELAKNAFDAINNQVALAP
jgi:uncharacterized repeat protein (TIGR01451 family)